jgi:hypothetical protein
MDKDDSLRDWEIKICPIRNKQCLQHQCAWWLEGEKMCAIKKLKPVEK